MLHRLPSYISLILLTLLLIPLTDAHAQSSYELDKLDAAMKARGLVQDPGIFDGSQFVAGTDPGKARSYMNSYIKQVNQTISTFNGLSSGAKGSEAGKRAYDRIVDLQSYTQSMRAALPEYEKAFAANGAAAQASSSPPVARESSAPANLPATSSDEPAADSELAQIITSLGRLDEMLASGDYDGKDFDALLSVDEVNAFTREFTSTANATVERMNTLPSESGRSQEGRQALDRLYQHLNVARSFRGAKSRHAQKRAAMEEISRQAEADAQAEREAAEAAANPDPRVALAENCAALTQTLQSTGSTIKHLVIHETTDWSKATGALPTRPELRFQNSKVTDAILDMVPICNAPEHAEVMALESGCDDNKVNDAVAWCRVASSYQSEAEEERERLDTTINSSYIPSVADLEAHNGFFSWPWNEPTWQGIMDKAEAELNDRQLAIFVDVIEGRAADWPPVAHAPEGEHTSYATELLASIYAKDPNIEVIDAWLSRTSWQINRNALGAILDRTNLGYILYQRAGEPFCILRDFVIREPYSGAGNYEKTDQFRMQSLRFQSCENR